MKTAGWVLSPGKRCVQKRTHPTRYTLSDRSICCDANIFECMKGCGAGPASTRVAKRMKSSRKGSDTGEGCQLVDSVDFHLIANT